MKRLIVAAALLFGMVAPATVQAAKPQPLLGGTLKSWIQALGPYESYSSADSPGWEKCPGVNTVRVMAAVLDGQFYTVNGQLCDGAKKPTTAQNIASARIYFPKDTLSKGTLNTGQGIDLEYFSASLGKTQAAKSMSQDCSQNTVKPGLFSLNTDSDGAGDWTLAVGTCS